MIRTRFPAVLLAFAALALAACAGPTFRDARRVEPYAELMARAAALPRHEVCAVTDAGLRPPLVVALEEVRSPDPVARDRPVLVLVPGLFSDRRGFRFLVAPLAARHDLLLVDPPGTGRSSQPDPDRHPAAYTPTWLAEHAWRALGAWQGAQPAPRRLVLVGHSLGGATILRQLAEPRLRATYAGVRAHVAGAVLIDPAPPAAGDSPNLREFGEMSDALFRLAEVTGVVDRRVSQTVHEGAFDPCRGALCQERARILEAFHDPCRRRAAQAMLRRFTPLDRCRRPLPGPVHEAEADLAAIDVPVRLLWGRHDPLLPLASGVRLASLVPGAELIVVERAAHSPHVDRPHVVAEHILAFAAGQG